MKSFSKTIVLAICLLFVVTAFSAIDSSASPSTTSGAYPLTYEPTIIFNGSIPQNFNHISPLYVNNQPSPWGPYNNIQSVFAAYNSTCMFLGFNATFQGNGFIVFIGNGTHSDLGTYNFGTMNVWQRSITFDSPVNYFFADFAGQPSQSYSIQSKLSSDNVSSYGISEPVSTYFTSSSIEISMPLKSIFGNSYGILNFQLSAFIIGGSGSWVGTGIPFDQDGHYNSGNLYSNFNINNTLTLSLNREKPLPPPPINLDIIYNDHQPLYSPISYSYWLLPWTDVHLEEYAEQALIIKKYHDVNVTYSLSGSLLLQIDAIRDGNYNNSYIKAAFIPESQWNNSVYYEMNHFGDTFLKTFVGRYYYNNTTVRSVLQNDLAFNSPSWVYSSGTPAGKEYSNLLGIYESGKNLTFNQLKDAVVEFFLWSVSYPIISGQLGYRYMDHSLLNLYNQTSFSISEIGKIISYYPYEANLVISTFLKDHENGNVELMTTPFDHPILPLLLKNNWTDQNGANITKGVWGNDVNAQLNVGRDIFYKNFGYYPSGQWTPEQAVSNAIVPFLAGNGVKWTSTDQAVLSLSGKLNATPGTALYYEELYKPYRIETWNGTETFVFRDSTLSNNWAFDYGDIASSQGSEAPVHDFISYLKNIYNTVPSEDHKNTLVTVAIDGENWMFMSPFPEDAVPFLQDLYSALSKNSSWIRTVNMNEYMKENRTEGNLTYLPTGSWNYQGYAGSVSPYLTQWAGHPTQDESWQQLSIVRRLVFNFGISHHLYEPINLSDYENSFNYPFIGEWNTKTLQDRYDEAWFSILAAEGSDIYFSFDPGDQNLYAQNDIVFMHEIREDMRNALNLLHIKETPYLKGNWTPSLRPQVSGGKILIDPQIDGSLYNTTELFNLKGFSVNNNNPWNGSYVYRSTGNNGLSVHYGYNASDLFIAMKYAWENPWFGTNIRNIRLYFSSPITGTGNLVGLSYPGAQFDTKYGNLLHYPAVYMVKVGPYNSTSENFPLEIYRSVNGTEWKFQGISGMAIQGQYGEFMIPLNSINFISGNFYEFTIQNGHSKEKGVTGPLPLSVHISQNGFHLISSTHNTARGNGPGNYTYPTLISDYPRGSVAIKWFNISLSSTAVRFSLRFGNLSNVFGGPYGFTQPVVDIYIHNPEFARGSTTTQPGVNAAISKSGAWQYMIQVAGFPGNAYIINSTNVNFGNDLKISSNLSISTVYVTVPIFITGINPLNDGYTVVSGFQNGYEPNGWNPVGIKASSYQGGGSGGPNSPNIYSYIAPAILGESPDLTQQEILSNYNSTHLAVLYPIYPRKLNYTQEIERSRVPSFNTFLSYGNLIHAFYVRGKYLYTAQSENGIQWTNSRVLLHFNSIANSLRGTFEGSIPILQIGTASHIHIYFPLNGSTQNITVPGGNIISTSMVSSQSNYWTLILNKTGVYIGSGNGWEYLFRANISGGISATYSYGFLSIYYAKEGILMERTYYRTYGRYGPFAPYLEQEVTGNIHGKVTSIDASGSFYFAEVAYTVEYGNNSYARIMFLQPFLYFGIGLPSKDIRYVSIPLECFNIPLPSLAYVGGQGNQNLYYFPLFF